VEIKRAAGRGVYIGNTPDYLQKDRYDQKGIFVLEIQALELPLGVRLRATCAH